MKNPASAGGVERSPGAGRWDPRLGRQIMLITILGSRGYIGTHFAQRLRDQGVEYWAPQKGEALDGRNLGTVVYCIGLTSDFRARPLETVEAHVCVLRSLIEHGRFQSLVYLSSTRVYKGLSGPVAEDAPCLVRAQDPDDLYNLSKLLGEALTHSLGSAGRVVRLSNVYGGDFSSQNFLTSILGDAANHNRVAFLTSLDSAKDYLHVDDVTAMLQHVTLHGRHPVYNLSSGALTTNRAIAAALEAAGVDVRVVDGAPTIVHPEVDNGRICHESGCRPRQLVEEIPSLIDAFRRHHENSRSRTPGK